PAWINAAISQALDSDRFTSSQRADARRLLEVQGDDFAGRGVALSDDLTSRISGERAELGKKISALRGDGPVVTDLDAETACNVAYLASMGMMAMGVIGAEPLLVA